MTAAPDKQAERIAELEAALVRVAFGLTHSPMGAMPEYMRLQVGAQYRVRVELPDGRRVYAALPYAGAAEGQPVRWKHWDASQPTKPATEEAAA